MTNGGRLYSITLTMGLLLGACSRERRVGGTIVMSSAADADANFVMTGTGGIVEVQGTAETVPFSQEGFDQLMALAKKGIAELVSLQKLTVA